MASIRPRSTRNGPVFAVLYRHAGRQTSTTFPTRAGAEAFAQRIDVLGVEAALADLAEPATKWTVPAWVLHHVDQLSGVTEGTKSDYRTYVRTAIAPHLDVPLTSVTVEAVERWVQALAATGMAGKTIRNRHALLSGALTRAVAAGHLPDNPCKGVRIPRTATRQMRVLSHSEFTALLYELPERWRPLATLLVGTGLRWGEATALTVGDVNLTDNRPTLRVRQAWKHTDGNGHTLGPPKSRAGLRTIGFVPEVADALRPLIEGRPPTAFVFTNTRGGPVRQNTFHEDAWTPALDRLGYPRGEGRPRIHDLRHTHASWLLRSGVIGLAELKYRMGHESITTTVDTYGHLMPDAHDRMNQAMTLALSSAFPAIED